MTHVRFHGLLPFQPATMSTAQLAAVSFLARYSGRTHAPYTYQLKRWFGWCQTNGLDPLVGIQRAHLGLSIRGLGDSGLVESSVGTMMQGVRGYFRFAHIDGLISADPAVYAQLPKVRDETRTQGLDRLELIQFQNRRAYCALTCEHVSLAGSSQLASSSPPPCLVRWPRRKAACPAGRLREASLPPRRQQDW